HRNKARVYASPTATVDDLVGQKFSCRGHLPGSSSREPAGIVAKARVRSQEEWSPEPGSEARKNGRQSRGQKPGGVLAKAESVSRRAKI
ncbi:unnamed protein product, partial [Staurois parvus]